MAGVGDDVEAVVAVHDVGHRHPSARRVANPKRMLAGLGWQTGLVSEPVRNRCRPAELTEGDVAAAIERIRASDGDVAAEAEHVVDSLTWGEGPGVIRQSGLQEWLWYVVPTKYLTDEVGYKGRFAETAAVLFDELGLDGYAAICRSEETAKVHEAFDRSDAAGRSALRKAIERSGIDPPDLDDFAWSSVMRSEDAVEREEPTIKNLDMDVTVVVGEDQVTFDAFGVTGDLEGTLRIGNNLDTRGTLRLVNGTYEKFGQELELRTARILFVGNPTQPYLSIEAVRTVDTVVAGIRLSGPVQSPTTEVFSTPDMPQTDALSYIILGRAPESRGDEGQMSGAAISLGLTQANKVTGKLGEEFGIDRLTLEAEGSGEQTSVVASGYLTEELSVRYGVGVFEPITTVAVRYDLGRYFYLEAASGLAASLDIFYTRDF